MQEDPTYTFISTLQYIVPILLIGGILWVFAKKRISRLVKRKSNERRHRKYAASGRRPS